MSRPDSVRWWLSLSVTTTPRSDGEPFEPCEPCVPREPRTFRTPGNSPNLPNHENLVLEFSRAPRIPDDATVSARRRAGRRAELVDSGAARGQSRRRGGGTPVAPERSGLLAVVGGVVRAKRVFPIR